jgi:hypothetical protein
MLLFESVFFSRPLLIRPCLSRLIEGEVGRLEWCVRVLDEEWLGLGPVLWLPPDAKAGRTIDRLSKTTAAATSLGLHILVRANPGQIHHPFRRGAGVNHTFHFL